MYNIFKNNIFIYFVFVVFECILRFINWGFYGFSVGTKNTPIQKRKHVHLTADNNQNPIASPSSSTSKKKKKKKETIPVHTPTSYLYISPRARNRPDIYDPSSPKNSKIKPVIMNNKPSPYGRTTKKKDSTPSTPASSKRKTLLYTSVNLTAGTVLAIRADDRQNFLLARVVKNTTIRKKNNSEVKHSVVQVKWLIEGREESLKGKLILLLFPPPPSPLLKTP